MKQNGKIISQRTKRCSKCNTVMDYLALGEYRCPSCGYEELDSYGIIRKYLDEHGSTPASVISLDTGISMEIINDYLAKGRLEVADTSNVFLHCEKCGKDIKFGRICTACAKNASSKMKETILPEEIGEEPLPISEIQGRMFSSERVKRRRNSF